MPPRSLSGASLEYVRLAANGWQSVPYDIISLFRSAGSSKSILVLGVSGCLVLPLVRLLWPRIRIVTNIDGLEWKRRKWSLLARLFLRLSEWSAVVFSSEIVADNEAIQDYLLETYKRASFFIPYGGDRTSVVNQLAYEANNEQYANFTQALQPGFYLGICRIEPENHIREIIKAFEQVTEARLVLIGNWEVSKYSKELYADYHAAPNMTLAGPIYEDRVLQELKESATAYIHGHSAGGTNPSLVEAMHSAMAIFAYDVDYNRRTTENLAVFWSNVGSLAECIRVTGTYTLQQNAEQMSEIAKRKYNWHDVTLSYRKLLFDDSREAADEVKT